MIKHTHAQAGRQRSKQVKQGNLFLIHTYTYIHIRTFEQTKLHLITSTHSNVHTDEMKLCNDRNFSSPPSAPHQASSKPQWMEDAPNDV